MSLLSLLHQSKYKQVHQDCNHYLEQKEKALKYPSELTLTRFRRFLNNYNRVFNAVHKRDADFFRIFLSDNITCTWNKGELFKDARLSVYKVPVLSLKYRKFNLLTNTQTHFKVDAEWLTDNEKSKEKVKNWLEHCLPYVHNVFKNFNPTEIGKVEKALDDKISGYYSKKHKAEDNKMLEELFSSSSSEKHDYIVLK